MFPLAPIVGGAMALGGLFGLGGSKRSDFDYGAKRFDDMYNNITNLNSPWNLAMKQNIQRGVLDARPSRGTVLAQTAALGGSATQGIQGLRSMTSQLGEQARGAWVNYATQVPNIALPWAQGALQARRAEQMDYSQTRDNNPLLTGGMGLLGSWLGEQNPMIDWFDSVDTNVGAGIPDWMRSGQQPSGPESPYGGYGMSNSQLRQSTFGNTDQYRWRL